MPTFSPDGRWLAVAGLANENVLVYGEDGREPVVLGGHAAVANDAIQCAWTGDGLLVTGHWTEGRARVWEMPGGRLVARDRSWRDRRSGRWVTRTCLRRSSSKRGMVGMVNQGPYP